VANETQTEQITTPKTEESKVAGKKVEINVEEEPAEVGEVALLKEDALLKEELAGKQKEAEEFHDRLLRKAAELENYKKRVQKEKEELTRSVREGLIYELLAVLDNFERALEAAASFEDKSALLDGVKLIYQQFTGVLAKIGLEEVPCQGGQTFDPNVHHAIAHVEAEGHSENAIVETCQKGYKLKGRLLRPALVAVAKGEPAPSTASG